MNARLRKVEGLNGSSIDKLEESGITEAEALSLGMYSVANASLLSANFEAQPALVIPYYNAERKPMRAHPAWPDFYRMRYLKESNVKGFGDLTEGKKQRYTQPPNTGVCAYLPLCTDWAAIQDAASEPVLITEGELKAAKACLDGFPTIGLGGVYNFRSSKAGIFWLPELEAFKWARRKVTIVYDSDYSEKPDICAAINVLAEELQARGAMVELASLPDVYQDDRKTGLDDLLVARGDAGLLEALSQSEPLALSTKLWRMNDELVYVADPGFIMVRSTGQKLTPSNFTAHSIWSTHDTPERKVKPDGSISYQKAPAAPAWVKWPLRQTVNKLTYRPGEDEFCTDDKGHLQYNQWRGWGVQPAKGDVKPWLDLIKFIFEGAEKDAVEWFLDWCAYPLQYPGTKLFSAVLVWGRLTGTGKTLLAYTLKRIYGANFIKIKNEDLKNTWWLENKQFILGDEISSNDKRSESDALKTMVTQEEVNINVKYVPQFSVPDVANYYFSSNHSEALFMEDEDRRIFVHEVQQQSALPDDFYQAYDKWKDSDAGAGALFHWLLQRDLSKFNPKAKAYRTAARQRMIMQGKSDLGTWVAELREFPAAKLTVGHMRHTKDLFTSHELLNMYAAEHDSAGKVTANGMSRALAAAGFNQVYNGNPIAVNGKGGRYFAVRNMDHWAKCKSMKDIIKNISQSPVRD